MNNAKPVICLEDDPEDQDMLREVFESLGIKHALKFFSYGQQVLDYLRNTTDCPFLIITDVNLPGMSGFKLREEICKDEYLRRKSIPYIFLSTSANKQEVDMAYEMQVQGYFQKENSFPALQSLIKNIMDYWSVCKHPNTFPK